MSRSKRSYFSFFAVMVTTVFALVSVEPEASAATSPVSGVVVTSTGVGAERFTGAAHATAGAEVWVQVLYGATASLGKLSASADLTANGSGTVSFSIPLSGLAVSTTYYYAIRVSTGGTFSSSPTTTFSTRPAPYWHGAQTPIAGQTLLSVSCPTTTFCETITPPCPGGCYLPHVATLSAASYNGNTWTASASIPNFPSWNYNVSCVSSTFCFAGNSGNESYKFDGTSWTYYKIPIGNPGDQIVCAAVTFCMDVDEYGSVVTWNGTTWGKAVSAADALGATDAVGVPTTCASSTFCMILTGSASIGAPSVETIYGGPFEGAALYNGSTWVRTGLVDPDYLLQDISCASTTLCVAVSQDGKAWKYNGSSWSGPVSIDTPTANVVTVSCKQNGCFAGTKSGDVIAFNGSTWGTPVHVGTSITSISCANLAFCVAVGGTNSWTFSQ